MWATLTTIGLGLAGLALIVFLTYRWGVARAKGKQYEKAVERAKRAVEIDEDTSRLTPDELRERMRDRLD